MFTERPDEDSTFSQPSIEIDDNLEMVCCPKCSFIESSPVCGVCGTEIYESHER